MKLLTHLLTLILALALPGKLAWAQASPSPSATSSTTAAKTPAARTDVYHVFFVKAAAGKSVQLLEMLKAPDPKAPMPGHLLVLRHQGGDAWDYVVIEHLGTKATVEATPYQTPDKFRDVIEWHNDTFVNGPSWTDFAHAMGMDDAAKGSTGAVYSVSVYRAVPGMRDQLEKFLSAPPDPVNDTQTGDVLMQHLEGGAWNFLSVSRYNSWADYGKNEMNGMNQALKSNDAGWFKLRDYVAFHTDTNTYRIMP